MALGVGCLVGIWYGVRRVPWPACGLLRCVVLAWLMALFILVPITELMLLLRIADAIAWGPTIALVLLTGALGAWLARREGLKVLVRIQQDMASGKPPTDAMVDGLLILVAGIVLITPGVITDCAGFALLIPPLRRMVRRQLGRSFSSRVVFTHTIHTQNMHPPGGPMDGGFVDVPVTGSSDDANHEPGAADVKQIGPGQQDGR